jgi:adenine phosphoribosyltransferase
LAARLESRALRRADRWAVTGELARDRLLRSGLDDALLETLPYWAPVDRSRPVGDTKVDVVVGMESRGFIFSAPLAYKLNAGFVPVRKLGKLPAETIEVEYELEYGTATLEIHSDAIGKGQRVLIVDDLLATGGTVMGTIELVRRLGGEIAGLSFMVELLALKGRDKLDDYDIHTLLTY